MFQVDSHIQQLDQYLKKSGEELRRGMLLIFRFHPYLMQPLFLCFCNACLIRTLIMIFFFQQKERILLLHRLLKLPMVPLNLEGPVKVEEEGVKSMHLSYISSLDFLVCCSMVFHFGFMLQRKLL